MSEAAKVYWLCVTSNGYWARGDTQEAAEKACKKLGGKLSTRNILKVYQKASDPVPFLDRYGCLSYGADGTVEKVAQYAGGKQVPVTF